MNRLLPPIFNDWLDRWRNRNRRQRPLTLAGRFFLIAAVICGHGLIDQTILPLLAYVLTVLGVAAVASFYFRPRINGRVLEPRLVHLGDDVEVRVMLTNRHRKFAFDVHIELIDVPVGWSVTEQERLLSALAAGETVTLSFNVKSVRRGVFSLPRLRVYSTFPFNLFCKTTVLESRGESVIAPAVDDATVEVDSQNRGIEMADLRGRRRASSSLDYVGSREYQPGTPVRRWDFSSWARLGTPTICEFVEGMHRNAILLVDLEKLARERSHLISSQDCFEALLSRAASTVKSLNGAGYEVQMFLIGQEVQAVSSQGDYDQKDDLFTALAGAQSVSTIDWAAAEDEIKQVALPAADVFAILSRSDKKRRSVIEVVASAAHHLAVDIVPSEVL